MIGLIQLLCQLKLPTYISKDDSNWILPEIRRLKCLSVGISEENTKCKIGIYIIYFEVFDTKGAVKSFKKTFVLGGKIYTGFILSRDYLQKC